MAIWQTVAMDHEPAPLPWSGISPYQADQLARVLERSRTVGFLGDGPVRHHIAHALGFVQALGTEVPARFLDLGSGGGVPGLVLAMAWPDAMGTLVDAQDKRCVVLRDAVESLGLGDRVTVRRGRAEELGRDPAFRSGFDAVTARSFGPPAVAAECGSPFLAVGGRLAVSEPPDGAERWPTEGVAGLGLVLEPTEQTPGARVSVLRQVTATPDRYPRRTGLPAKRPLF